MDHDRGRRVRPVKVLDTLRQYKYVVLTAALGIFLLLLPSSEEKAADTGTVPTVAERFDRAALQSEMEDILSSLDGVGRLSLMLTVDGGSEYELAQDETAARKFSGTESGEQSRSSETVVLGSGSGAEVVITRSRYPRFLGALVVCEGGDRADVQLKVTQAVGALTGLSSDRITVVKGMKQLWKRNAVVGTILVFVCAAIFLNGKYAEKVEQPTKVLGQAQQVDGADGEAAEVSAGAEGSDYFASARLTRQQARDSALSLLKEASENDSVDEETVNEAAKSIQTLASYALSESQIENMITAKGYDDCVVFLSEDGVSVVVSAGEEGLQTEDVARITDIVKQETGLTAESIKIMEVN